MGHDELMNEVKIKFNEWLNDKTMDDYYRGNKVALQQEFISCIQLEIESDFVVITRDELLKKQQDYHNSMEGTDWGYD